MLVLPAAIYLHGPVIVAEHDRVFEAVAEGHPGASLWTEVSGRIKSTDWASSNVVEYLEVVYNGGEEPALEWRMSGDNSCW